MRSIIFLLLLSFGAQAQVKITLNANCTFQINPGTPNPCGTFTPTVRNLNNTGTNEIYRPNTSSWVAGDTLRITATTALTVMEIYGGGGTYCRPIIIDIPANLAYL
jgi:hypothetical protein